MPELPEVEAAWRAVSEHCLNKKVKKVIVANDDKVITGVSPSDFEAAILGKTIVAAHQKDKNLWLQLDSPPFLSFQFGMAGAIYINGVAVAEYKRSAVKDTDEWPSKYSKFFIELDDGLELSFTDKRRLAKVRFLEDPTSVPLISELGPDALFEPMSVDEFTESLRKRKIGIKTLLLDQSYISGIGNWVADEVLYQARIHPQQITSSLSKESCVALHKSIEEVVQYSVKVDDDSSCFPPDWLFHFRWGKKAGKLDGMKIDFITAGGRVCDCELVCLAGMKIDFITAGGRTTAYVPELQKLSGGQVAKASSTPKKPSKRKGVEDDDEAPESEPEKANESAKPKKKKRQTQEVVGKKSATAKKSNVSDDDNDDGHGNNSHIDGSGGPMWVQGGSPDTVCFGVDANFVVQKWKSRKVTNNKQAKGEKTSKVTVNNKKPKGNAKLVGYSDVR